MGVDGDGFAPAQPHQAHAVGDFGTDALQREELRVRLPVAFTASFEHLAGRACPPAQTRTLGVAETVQPVRALLLRDHDGRLVEVPCPVPEAELAEVLLHLGVGERAGRREVVVRLRADVADQRAVVHAQLLDHLRDPGDVVVAAAYEADEGLPCILLQDAHAGEPGRFPLEVRVRGRPLFVELYQVRGQVEVVLDERERALVVVRGGSVDGWRVGEQWCRRRSICGQREDCAVMEVLAILSQ